MSCAVETGVRCGYGSRWIATSSAYRFAAALTSGRRSASAECRPHHETTTVPMPAARISRICSATTRAFDDE